MTDNEIIKALAELANLNIKYGSRKCKVVDIAILKDALNLINRQRAEIEELKKPKENAKRIIEHCESFPICVGCSFALPNGGCVFEETSPSNWELDDIKEEMVGEDNA